MATKYPRGSEWRRWDLQVQTILDEGYASLKDYAEALKAADTTRWGLYTAKVGGEDNALLFDSKAHFTDGTKGKKPRCVDYVRNFFAFLETFNPDLACIGVTDHNYFDPVLLDTFIEYGKKSNCKVIPGVEINCNGVHMLLYFRSILYGKETFSSGIHAFLTKFNIDAAKKNGVLTVTSSDIKEIIAETKKNNGIIIYPHCSSDNGLFKLADKTLLADAFNSQPINLLQCQNRETFKTAVDAIAKNKNLKAQYCMHISSDARSLRDTGRPDKDGNFLWIKADPTFEGFEQILHEPEDRVFIGVLPPVLEAQRTRPTRIMRELSLRKSPETKTDEQWFDGARIPLNSELIAIIGNKGSGKSALADIMGLLGHTTRYEAFSFLHKNRFRDKGKAKQFQASLKWSAETAETWTPLDQDPPADSVEKLKYIPQQYLELICAEIGLGKKSPFYSELEQVIFSHVLPEDRLTKPTLAALLEHRGKETKEAIGLLVGEIWEINKVIVAIEERLAEKNRKALKSQLDEKKLELEAHRKTIPVEKLPPAASLTTLKESEEVSVALKTKREALLTIEASIAEAQKTLSAVAQDQSKAEKLLTKIGNLEHYTASFQKEVAADVLALKLDLNEIASVKIDYDPINKLLVGFAQKRQELESLLKIDIAGSCEAQRVAIAAEIQGLEAKLDAPQREYQAYLDALKKWEGMRDTLTGSEIAIGSIKYIEAQLSELEILPKSLKKIYRDRERKVLEIFREKSKLRRYYRSYYGEVQDFLSGHELAKSGQFKMAFNVSIAESNFEESFFKMINQRKTGSFSATQDGTTKLKQLLAATNFDSALSSIRFVRKLMGQLRKFDGKDLPIADQLKQGESVSVEDLYRLIFSLNYLEPRYSLQWDGKGLEQLSPGERGNLLLIFFLLVDKDDRPLIIDQPEENLDNQTVYRTLVPCIKNAKKRRQIILVTHNPNLAVVCDAEQVIYSQINKEQKNEVIYETGSLEDPEINSRVIDVLEGTRPAFDKRDDKYLS